MANKQDVVQLGYIGVGGQKGYVYSVDGVSTTELSAQYKDPIKILIRIKT